MKKYKDFIKVNENKRLYKFNNRTILKKEDIENGIVKKDIIPESSVVVNAQNIGLTSLKNFHNNITDLLLDHNNITNLKDVPSKTNKLYVEVNNLNVISEKLPKLDTLSLNYNNLTGLENIGEVGYLSVTNNKLTSLKGDYGSDINRTFIFNNNKITDLTNPIKNCDSFTISYNPITSLENLDFTCLEFNCHGTSITNLKGCPKKTYNATSNGNYSFQYSKKLTSLEGIPEKIGGIDLTGCSNLKSLKHLKEFSQLNISKTKVYTLSELVHYPGKVKYPGMIEYEGSNLSKLEVDFYINLYDLTDYYLQYIDFIKKNIHKYDEKEIGKIHIPEELLNNDKELRNLIKSSSNVKKYNL